MNHTKNNQSDNSKPGIFTKLTSSVSVALGRPWVFIIAFGIVLGWALAGPIFGYSNTWQLFINTGTTVITFLMVFIIQHTQNRDNKAINIKLDAIINKLNLADADDEDVDKDVLAAEDKSDKTLETLLEREQKPQ